MIPSHPLGLQALGAFFNRAASQPLAPVTGDHAAVARALSDIVGHLGDRQSGYGQASRQLRDVDQPKRVAAGMKAVFGWLKSGNAKLAEAIAGAVRPEPELADAAFLDEARLDSPLQERISRLFSSGIVAGGEAVFAPAVAANLSEDLSYLREFGLLELVLNRQPAAPYRPFLEEWFPSLPEGLQAKIRRGAPVTVTADDVKTLHDRTVTALAAKDAPRATALLASMDWLFAHKPKSQGGPYEDLFNHYSRLALRVSNEMPREPVFAGADLRREMEEALRRQDFVRAQNLFQGMTEAGPEEGLRIMALEEIIHPFVRLQILKFYLGYTDLADTRPGLREGLLERELHIALLSARTRSLFDLTCLAWINGWLVRSNEAWMVQVIAENTMHAIGKLLSGASAKGRDHLTETLEEDAVEIEEGLSSGLPPGVPAEARPLIERRDMRGISREALDAIGASMETHGKDAATLDQYRALFLLAYNTMDDPFLRTKAHDLLERVFRLGVNLAFTDPKNDATVDEMKDRFLADPMGTLFDINLSILAQPDPKTAQIHKMMRERLRARWED